MDAANKSLIQFRLNDLSAHQVISSSISNLVMLFYALGS